MSDFENFLPPKPELVRNDKNSHPAVTVFSIILFALTFSLIINDYLFIAFLLIVLILHELGHFLVMKYFGYQNLKMLFIPFLGALVQGRKSEYSQKQSALVILAGPIPGIIVGFLLLDYGLSESVSWMIELGILFLVLNLLNLLPIDPLDGGQLMKIMFFGNQEMVQLVFSFLSSIGIILLGLIFNSWLLILFGFILGFRVKNLFNLYQIRKEMQKENIAYNSTYEDLSNLSFKRIKAILFEFKPVLKDIEEHSDNETFNKLIANQVNNVLIDPVIKDVNVFLKILFFIAWVGTFLFAIYYMLNLNYPSLANAFPNW